jgi:hypothetical protein
MKLKLYKRNKNKNIIPFNWADWAKWTSFMEKLVKLWKAVKLQMTHPKNAPKNAVLVYDKWFGSTDRRENGHVELTYDLLGKRKYLYWYWTKYGSKIPWGSAWKKKYINGEYERKIISWEIDDIELYCQLTWFKWIYVVLPLWTNSTNILKNNK